MDESSSTAPSSPSPSSSGSAAPYLISSDQTEPGAFAVFHKAARASILAKWLVETFRQGWLRDGGVIDIAGGRVCGYFAAFLSLHKI